MELKDTGDGCMTEERPGSTNAYSLVVEGIRIWIAMRTKGIVLCREHVREAANASCPAQGTYYKRKYGTDTLPLVHT